MTTRIANFRQRNVKSDSTLSLPVLQSGEVGRVIINHLHIKLTETGESVSWVNFWAHLYLVPSGFNSIATSWPEPESSRIPVASMTAHTISGTSTQIKLPHTITLCGGATSTAFDTAGTLNSRYLIETYADFLGSADGVQRNKTLLSGTGYVSGGTTNGVFIKWNVPEYFYMGPGDSLLMNFGGYSGAQQYIDTDSTNFIGTDIDLVYVIDSN